MTVTAPARRLATSAALVSALGLASKILGFGREAALAAVFGASGASDAYFVALILPGVMLTLLSEVLVTASLPVLADHVTDGADHEHRATVLWTMLHGALLVAALLTVGGWAFAPQLVGLMAPGLAGPTRELAAALTRVLMPSVLLMTVVSWSTAVLHAHQRFTRPALIGVPYNVIVIAAALWAGYLAGRVGIAEEYGHGKRGASRPQ